MKVGGIMRKDYEINNCEAKKQQNSRRLKSLKKENPEISKLGKTMPQA